MEYSVFDAHCDTLCKLLDEGGVIEKNPYHVDMDGMKQYKKYTQIFACYIAPEYANSASERCMRLIDTFYHNNIKGILSIEGGECFTSLSAVRDFYRLGVRIATLTWNGANHLASGADDPEKRLTEFGKSVLCEMDNVGMLFDVSHLNDRSFYDAVSVWKKPIIATHSNSRSICPHRRNLTDEMFKIIKNSGGCVGINFYPPFLCEKGTAKIDDIIRHIEHFMALGGEDNIGIGADYDGVDCLPDGITGCGDTYKVFDRLLGMNYSDEQIEKISHKNFERIFKDV
ncbi:MAG: membrane dipeptidase [Clostridia bacterium]|nr:membrane dipeptidase [Clostridia bacterium]